MAITTIKDIKEEVLAHGFSPQNYSARIINWANEALGYIYRTSNLLEGFSNQTFETSASDDNYPLESQFARISQIYLLNNEPDTRLIPFKNNAEFQEAERIKGEPTQYIISFNDTNLTKEIWLRPIPDKNYSLEVRYQRTAPTNLEEADLIPITLDYAWLLTEFCLYKGYLSEGDIEMSNKHKEIFDSGLIRFTGDVQNDRRDGVEVIEGGWQLGYQ